MIPEFACKAVDETTKALWLQKVYLRIATDTLPKTRIGFQLCHGEMNLKQIEQGLSSFSLLIFAIFDDFLKGNVQRVLRNFEKIIQ